MNDSVRVVLTNWRRPENLARIAAAYRQQTVPVELVTVDNSGGGKWGLPDAASALMDDVVEFGSNAGPACRFAGAWFAQTDYILFHDDDMVPGEKCVENYLNSAKKLKGEFGVIGWLGRRAAWGMALSESGIVRRPTYKTNNVGAKKKACHPVDFTCRGMFVRRDVVWTVQRFRERLHVEVPDEAERLAWEDDMTMAMAVRLELGLRSYLRPRCSRERSQNGAELPDARAQSGLSSHRAVRKRLIEVATEMGWRGWIK